jgi:hypothetical protein
VVWMEFGRIVERTRTLTREATTEPKGALKG